MGANLFVYELANRVSYGDVDIRPIKHSDSLDRCQNQAAGRRAGRSAGNENVVCISAPARSSKVLRRGR